MAFSSPIFAGLPTVAVSVKACSTKINGRATRRQESNRFLSASPISLPRSRALEVAIPLAASAAILLWPNPVHAGILSGFSGLESIPGPQLPQIDFLNKWNEENQKKYAEFDKRFKSSTVLKELLERSKLNKERNRREIEDKYCLRGAEWGVGDCSTEGMTQEERDDFVGLLKKRVGGD
ncbi:uncharacterized protein LOC103710183 [Phoenix dactylifera]|uniref:Uncharacterized protein LOC103710183 n=1 Tax=Phoenix dactylifera TaxID=42345 RepID=A0A8B7C8V6_PHODC|nr:uncharacterized protein LOC103710183 [Phoenix dactylifera]XP_008794058.2 uncharacterized protein LOC103710183 [Phoenix dactylifera]XP_026661883.2 uncharacterized protein LOC103710183 [Phoenix dactylifera]